MRARSLGSAGAALATVERALADADARSSPRGGRNCNCWRPPCGASGSECRCDDRRTFAQRITEGKLIDPAGDNAKDLIANLRAAAPNRPEVEELSRALTTRLLDISKQAMNAKAFDRSGQLIAAAREVGARYNEAGIAQAERDLVAARELQRVRDEHRFLRFVEARRQDGGAEIAGIGDQEAASQAGSKSSSPSRSTARSTASRSAMPAPPMCSTTPRSAPYVSGGSSRWNATERRFRNGRWSGCASSRSSHRISRIG